MTREDFEKTIILVEDKLDSISEIVCEFNMGLERELNVILNELKELKEQVEKELNDNS